VEYGPKEMAEDYQVVLRICGGDKERARELFEWYLRGRTQGDTLRKAKEGE